MIGGYGARIMGGINLKNSSVSLVSRQSMMHDGVLRWQDGDMRWSCKQKEMSDCLDMCTRRVRYKKAITIKIKQSCNKKSG